MIHRRLVYYGALLALSIVGACSSDDNPASPLPGMSTEVSLAFDEGIPQGTTLNALVKFSATTEESVVISYGHSAFLGFRVFSADGELVMIHPSEVFGEPFRHVVRPGGWYLATSFSVPTALSQEEAQDRYITWLCEDEILPSGEYILEAGLYDRGRIYPWGEARFELINAVPTR